MKNALLLGGICLLGLMFNTLASYGQKYERYKHLKDTTILSQNLGFDKSISITVPLEWQSDLNSNFPLVIIFDRQNERSHQYMLNAIDYLTSIEQMPSCVIISIASDERYRLAETLASISDVKGLQDKNEAFLFDEIIPMAETHFDVSKFRTFIGHSRYGYFTTSLMSSRLSEVNAIISASPFFKQDNVNLVDSVRALNEINLDHTKYWRFAIGNDYPKEYARMDKVLMGMNNSNLNIKGYLFQEADHNATPGLLISTALYQVFEFWSRQQYIYMKDNQVNDSNLKLAADSVKAHYGSDVRFSLGVLNGKGWSFFNKGAFDTAIKAWEIMMDKYPNFSEGYIYMAEALKQQGKDNSEMLAAFKKSFETSQFYSPEERQALLDELEK